MKESEIQKATTTQKHDQSGAQPRNDSSVIAKDIVPKKDFLPTPPGLFCV